MTGFQVMTAICTGILIGSIGCWLMMKNKFKQHNQKDEPDDGLKQCESIDELSKYLDKRFRYHILRATEHSNVYKMLGCFFLASIPIMSSFLTVLIDNDGLFKKIGISVDQGNFTLFFSGCLSLFTIVNSIIKPSRAFNNAANNCIDLMDWKLERDIEFIKIKEETLGKQYEAIKLLNKKMSAIGRDMARDLMPADAKRSS